MPAWVTILISHNDWIAASIEAGGIPAMLLGLYNTVNNHRKDNRLFNHFASLSTYSALAFGLAISIVHHGGMHSISQLLEIGIMLGFLLGSYFLAKGQTKGWIFFMLMNISMATLMYNQNKPFLMLQQLLSLGFVVFGFMHAQKSRLNDQGK